MGQNWKIAIDSKYCPKVELKDTLESFKNDNLNYKKICHDDRNESNKCNKKNCPRSC